MDIFIPYGLFILDDGKPTKKDLAHVNKVARVFLNFKNTSQLSHFRRYYKLPDGGHFVVQHMGGVFKVLVYKPPVDEIVDEEIELIKIPMLFCGAIYGDALVNSTSVALTISSLTRKRLVAYSSSATLPDSSLVLARFNVSANTDVISDFSDTVTQYERQKPTWYSGAMAEVMQIVGGYGIQPTESTANTSSTIDVETVQMVLPAKICKLIQKEQKGVILPCYTGIPNTKGQFQYDFRFNKTHAVGFDAAGYPWLLQVSSGGLYAMPLPIIPETASTHFRDYVISVEDTELLAVLDRFGALPSGESFPTDSTIFSIWYRAGVIIKLCDTATFYTNTAYSQTCGWSFNTTGSIGFNTCYATESSSGYMVGYAYQLDINLVAATIHAQGWAQTTSVPSASIESVSTYLAGLNELLSTTDQSKAIRYKLRNSLDLLIERAETTVSSYSDELSYWDALVCDPIAAHSATLTQSSNGYLYYNSKHKYQAVKNFIDEEVLSSEILSDDSNVVNLSDAPSVVQVAYDDGYVNTYYTEQPYLRFPDLSKSNSFTKFYLGKQGSNLDTVNCDTPVFGFFVGDTLKIINYYISWDAFEKTLSSDFLPPLQMLGSSASLTMKSSSVKTGYFYASDYELRNESNVFNYSGELALPYLKDTGNLFLSTAAIGRMQIFLSNRSCDMEIVSAPDMIPTIPYFDRNNCLFYKEKQSSLKYECNPFYSYKVYEKYAYNGAITYIDPDTGIELSSDQRYFLVSEQVTLGYIDTGSWASVGDKILLSNIKSESTINESLTASYTFGDFYVTRQQPAFESSLIYGAGFDTTKEIVDTTDRESYFTSDEYMDCFKNAFGTTTFASVALSSTSGDRYIEGSTSLIDTSKVAQFIGVINE